MKRNFFYFVLGVLITFVMHGMESEGKEIFPHKIGILSAIEKQNYKNDSNTPRFAITGSAEYLQFSPKQKEESSIKSFSDIKTTINSFHLAQFHYNTKKWQNNLKIKSCSLFTHDEADYHFSSPAIHEGKSIGLPFLISFILKHLINGENQSFFEQNDLFASGVLSNNLENDFPILGVDGTIEKFNALHSFAQQSKKNTYCFFSDKNKTEIKTLEKALKLQNLKLYFCDDIESIAENLYTMILEMKEKRKNNIQEGNSELSLSQLPGAISKNFIYLFLNNLLTKLEKNKTTSSQEEEELVLACYNYRYTVIEETKKEIELRLAKLLTSPTISRKTKDIIFKILIHADHNPSEEIAEFLFKYAETDQDLLKEAYLSYAHRKDIIEKYDYIAKQDKIQQTENDIRQSIVMLLKNKKDDFAGLVKELHTIATEYIINSDIENPDDGIKKYYKAHFQKTKKIEQLTTEEKEELRNYIKENHSGLAYCISEAKDSKFLHTYFKPILEKVYFSLNDNCLLFTWLESVKEGSKLPHLKFEVKNILMNFLITTFFEQVNQDNIFNYINNHKIKDIYCYLYIYSTYVPVKYKVKCLENLSKLNIDQDRIVDLECLYSPFPFLYSFGENYKKELTPRVIELREVLTEEQKEKIFKKENFFTPIDGYSKIIHESALVIPYLFKEILKTKNKDIKTVEAEGSQIIKLEDIKTAEVEVKDIKDVEVKDIKDVEVEDIKERLFKRSPDLEQSLKKIAQFKIDYSKKKYDKQLKLINLRIENLEKINIKKLAKNFIEIQEETKEEIEEAEIMNLFRTYEPINKLIESYKAANLHDETVYKEQINEKIKEIDEEIKPLNAMGAMPEEQKKKKIELQNLRTSLQKKARSYDQEQAKFTQENNAYWKNFLKSISSKTEEELNALEKSANKTNIFEFMIMETVNILFAKAKEEEKFLLENKKKEEELFSENKKLKKKEDIENNLTKVINAMTIKDIKNLQELLEELLEEENKVMNEKNEIPKIKGNFKQVLDLFEKNIGIITEIEIYGLDNDNIDQNRISFPGKQIQFTNFLIFLGDHIFPEDEKIKIIKEKNKNLKNKQLQLMSENNIQPFSKYFNLSELQN